MFLARAGRKKALLSRASRTGMATQTKVVAEASWNCAWTFWTTPRRSLSFPNTDSSGLSPPKPAPIMLREVIGAGRSEMMRQHVRRGR